MNVTVVSPNNATITCVADGVPAPNITWFRDFNGLMEIPELVEETIDSTNVTVLKVTQTQMDRTTTSTIEFFFTQPPYAAEYTCRASNLLGTIEQVAVLTVQGKGG